MTCDHIRYISVIATYLKLATPCLLLSSLANQVYESAIIDHLAVVNCYDKISNLQNDLCNYTLNPNTLGFWIHCVIEWVGSGAQHVCTFVYLSHPVTLCRSIANNSFYINTAVCLLLKENSNTSLN
jgi:hypothetical protein